jgi:hypothetical protein
LIAFFPAVGGANGAVAKVFELTLDFVKKLVESG